ncbi:MAG: hypothetical protein RhofKO_31610 [Rhodothermales bacterium]
MPATIRDQVLRAVEEMPSDVTFDEVMDRIYMLQKIETGRRQLEAGEGIPHDEAKRTMKRWHG